MKTDKLFLLGFALLVESTKSLMACEGCTGEKIEVDLNANVDASASRNMEHLSFRDDQLEARSLSIHSIVFNLKLSEKHPDTDCGKSLAEFKWMKDDPYFKALYEEVCENGYEKNSVEDRKRTIIDVAINKIIERIHPQKHVFCGKCRSLWRQSDWSSEELVKIKKALENFLKKEVFLPKKFPIGYADFAGSVVIAALCAPKIEIDFTDGPASASMPAFCMMDKKGNQHVVFDKNFFLENDDPADPMLQKWYYFAHEMGHATDHVLGIAPNCGTITAKSDFIKDLYCQKKDIVAPDHNLVRDEEFHGMVTNSANYCMVLQWWLPIEAWQMQGFAEVDGVVYKNDRCDRNMLRERGYHLLAFFHQHGLSCQDCKKPWTIQFCCDALKLLHAFPSLKNWQLLGGYTDADVKKGLYEQAKEIRVKSLQYWIIKAFHPEVLQQALEDPDVQKILTDEDRQVFSEATSYKNWVLSSSGGCSTWNTYPSEDCSICPIF